MPDRTGLRKYDDQEIHCAEVGQHRLGLCRKMELPRQQAFAILLSLPVVCFDFAETAYFDISVGWPSMRQENFSVAEFFH